MSRLAQRDKPTSSHPLSAGAHWAAGFNFSRVTAMSVGMRWARVLPTVRRDGLALTDIRQGQYNRPLHPPWLKGVLRPRLRAMGITACHIRRQPPSLLSWIRGECSGGASRSTLSGI